MFSPLALSKDVLLHSERAPDSIPSVQNSAEETPMNAHEGSAILHSLQKEDRADPVIGGIQPQNHRVLR